MPSTPLKNNASLKRCFGTGKDFYEKYHDEEWGIPVHDDQKHFEMLCLEISQAGLSWEIILKKRQGYLENFHRFNPQKVAKMKNSELELLIKNSAIVRNRKKIFAIRQNAIAFLEIQKTFGSFDNYLWSFVDKKPIIGRWKNIKEVPAETTLSVKISKNLKKHGMIFVGPKIIYSYMQAVGIVNDHVKTCWRYPIE